MRAEVEASGASERQAARQKLQVIAFREMKAKNWLGVQTSLDCMAELELLPAASSLAAIVNVSIDRGRIVSSAVLLAPSMDAYEAIDYRVVAGMLLCSAQVCSS